MGHNIDRCIIISVLLTTKYHTHALNEVTLQTSYMSRPVLCPGEPRPTFTCFTVGHELRWTVGEIQLIFNGHSEVGEENYRLGFHATLLGKRNDFTCGDGQISTLHSSILTLPETLPAGVLTVQCDNAEISQNISYHHVAGELKKG